MMSFSVGQKIVCVAPVNDLIKNHVYVVTTTVDTCLGPFVGVDQTSFTGIAFYAWRFRPLVERKTSIEIFQKMLDPSPEKVMDAVIFDTLADIYLAHKQWTS